MHFTRRIFLSSLSASAALAAPGVFAELLERTPRQTEGPFYPDHLPLDTDNDLIVLNNSLNPAVGEVTHLSGRVLNERGEPLRNAVVEIWQVDNNGVYIHSRSPRHDQLDGNFQGFGRFLTGSSGEYYFRTIKPVAYRDNNFGRAPHIHFAIQAPGLERLTTQCYIKGHEMNAADGVFRAIASEAGRAAVQVEFSPLAQSGAGELAAKFDIVLGLTPADA